MNCLGFSRWLLSILLGGSVLAVLSGHAKAAAPLQASCHLQSAGNKIKRVVSITFDNVHLRRDNPNVPSDLEQMPNLLNFLLDNGIVSGNHHTPLISHTATDILTTLTGVYGDRMGVPVANSYGFFRPDGSVGFSSSFLYWTSPSGGSLSAGDGEPQMVNENGKTAPAPWVPFTRAGCDVGAFSVANIEFESIPADVNTVFGATSPEGLEANNPALRDKANADFLGIAVHCAQGSALCANPHGRPDLLPDEPGGYTGFNALYGNFHVQPVISPSGPIRDLDGNIIQTAAGNPGFPNIFNPLATQSLGYAAAMLEAGVPVVYVYISDAHDQHSTGPARAFGPGEAEYVAQLKAYDAAFGKFFDRLKADGITKNNTLFVVVPDENDHFVGGPPSPTNCDGINTPCTYAKIGEIDAILNRLLITQRQNSTTFSVHSDDAPTVYIKGNPAPTDLVTRTVAHDLNALTAVNPITGQTDKLSVFLADQAEMRLLHMVTSSPARTPTLTMFGNEDYFFFNGSTADCSVAPACIVEDPGFAWNHGDVQQDITRTWFAMAGPGVRTLGRNDEVFSDHTDIRPTIMALLGLNDDYIHDGRVLVEDLDEQALPHQLRDGREDFAELAKVYKQLNAPLGSLGRNSLKFANRAITSDDTTYRKYLKQIGDITVARDQLAAQINTVLNAAAFEKSVGERENEDLVERAKRLIDQVEDLARRGK
ncbi:MAG TPA: hypothetical protein VLJ17_17560 [Xanthobacteraceae bacterium]|nr:hypothetical protein [Xanthobacteraceae bacterium]